MDENLEIPREISIERSVFEQFISHTLLYSEKEWGGLLLGKKENNKIQCIAAILPPQKSQSAAYCEFRKEIMFILTNLFEKVEDKFGEHDFMISTWIHTHPNMGVFLSGTDEGTYGELSKFNKELCAVVVDPVQYEWMGVNTRPGNCYGFTQLDIDLNYLYDFSGTDQSLIEKLTFIQENINSDRNRKILQLLEDDKIEVFIPVSLDTLKHKLIISNLAEFKKKIQKTGKMMFNKDSDIKIIVPKEENPQIQPIAEYQAYFGALNKEIRSWKGIRINQLLFEYDINALESYYPIEQILAVKRQIDFFSGRFGVQSVYIAKLRENSIEFGNDESYFFKDLSSIKKIEFDKISLQEQQLCLLTIKFGLFKKETFLFYDIFQSVDKFLNLLMSKVKIERKQNVKARQLFNEKLRMEKELEDRRIKEDLKTFDENGDLDDIDDKDFDEKEDVIKRLEENEEDDIS